MKFLLFSILLFSLKMQADAQLSGKLTRPTGEPLPYAIVTLLSNRDSAVVKSVLTNEKGIYQIENIDTGKYILRYSSMGYQTYNSPVFELILSNDKKDFGTHIMNEDNGRLKDVLVKAEKPLYRQQPEGMIVNAESSVLSKGSSVLQVLERSPGIFVNRRDNNIQLNGKSGAVIMIDGKLVRMSMEQLLALLNSMNAGDISTIELLTTPGAKYDAEGSAGLINIVLKKSKQRGTNGSFSLTGGYGWREKASAGINVSHNVKNINLYGSYTFSHNQTYSGLYITSTQKMPFLGGDVSVLFLDTTKAINNGHDASAGIDIKLSTKTTIGASVIYNGSNRSLTTVNNAAYNILPDSVLQFNGVNKAANHWNNLVSSIYLEKIMSEGEKLKFDLDYLHFNTNNASVVKSSFTDKEGEQAESGNQLFAPRQKGFANTTIHVAVARLDYEKQLNKKLKLETGVKGTYTRSSSISGIESLVNGQWTSSGQTTNHIYMKEITGAFYTAVNMQINPLVNLTLGARYEYAYTNMHDPKTGSSIVKRKLGSLFPSVFLSKKINDQSEVQFSYTKRISRPSYNDLASYVSYSDPTAVYTGNPFLKPTITHNVKIGYNLKGYAFSILLSRDENTIARYQLSESPSKDILYISPKNVSWQNSINLQVNLPFKLNSWWTMTYGFTGGPRQYKFAFATYPFEKKYVGYALNSSQVFKLPNDFSAEFSGFYNNAFYNGTQRINGYGLLNAGIKKDLKNNKGSLQLSVADLLRNERMNIYYGSIIREAFNIKNHVIYSGESSRFPIIKLTYTRSFGSITKNNRKQTGVDVDERVRKE